MYILQSHMSISRSFFSLPKHLWSFSGSTYYTPVITALSVSMSAKYSQFNQTLFVSYGLRLPKISLLLIIYTCYKILLSKY